MYEDDEQTYCSCECCLYWRERIGVVSGKKEFRAVCAERALREGIKALRCAESAAKSGLRFTFHGEIEAK